MEEMRRIAHGCVARAFGFASFAIAVTMIGLTFNLLLAVKTGGVLFLIVASAFLIKAQYAPKTDYRRTELWVVLPPDLRPSAEHAQWASGVVRREAFMLFAQHAAVAAAALFAAAIVLSLAR